MKKSLQCINKRFCNILSNSRPRFLEGFQMLLFWVLMNKIVNKFPLLASKSLYFADFKQAVEIKGTLYNSLSTIELNQK
jgi:hypothetical protein